MKNLILAVPGIKIARPKAGRLRRLQNFNIEKSDIDTLIEMTKIALEGPIDQIDWDEAEIPDMQEILAVFIEPVNATAAKRLRSLIASNRQTAKRN